MLVPEKDTPWWHTLYDQHLAEILLENADPKDAIDTLHFFKNHLKLKPGMRVLDQCCGTGRCAVLLAEEHNVVGIDLIPQYIDLAQTKVATQKRTAEFICDDALTFTLQPPADFAYNWWTSFGYAKEDATNIKMVDCAYRSLVKGGIYALDFMNVPGLYKNFQTDVMSRTENSHQSLMLIRHSQLDFTSNRLVKEWSYYIDGQFQTRHFSEVKLYLPAQLIEMFKQVGFTEIRLYGDLDGSAFSLNSRRCIVVGKK